ncbi:FAD binding domain protein [Camillea tinctor]|nr:FAD binding domain protein [Camillea tinctor]
MERYPLSGISILIVGSGIAGLGFAIEAYRKGHSVKIVERRPNFHDRGAVIGVQEPAMEQFKLWPGFTERLEKIIMAPSLRMMKHDMTLIGDFPVGNKTYPAVTMSRPALHQLLYNYVQELGIAVELAKDVAEYFEDEDRAGVIYADGARETADVVVAADGVGSKAWTLITGNRQDVISSGFLVQLATFPAEKAMKNPVVAEGWKGMKDGGLLFNLGHNAHLVIGRSNEEMCWMLVHRDYTEADESWSGRGSKEAALKVIEGWAPFFHETIKATPEPTDGAGGILLWRLMWRDPQPKCVSPLGRLVQIGDAAHPFLPTSAAGASMALEDAYSVASCLQIAGKGAVPLALRVHNLMRFERVCCAQKLGFRNREMFHKTNWDGVEENPESVSQFAGDWLGRHHVEQYVYDNYGKAAHSVVMGTPFVNTNSVPGFKFRPWTVKELLEASDRGEPIVDEGEW